MLVFLKKFYIFMLILMVFSYLLPKAEYKKYMQFFIGIFVVVLLLKPVLEFIYMDNLTWVYEMFQTFNTQIENVELDMEENIYEYFFDKGEGE